MEKITRLAIYAFICLSFAFTFHSAKADDFILISDAETQNYLSAVIKPLYHAAGINFDDTKVYIVRDNSLNAFVSSGNNMFVHTGTLLAVDDTNELAGILAHETGHILGGHIVRQKLKLKNMNYIMLGSMIAAGAAAVSTGRGDAAVAVLMGSQSSALSSLLHYQVQEERTADESAVKLLDKTKQSTLGLLRFMNKIKKHNHLSGISEQDYFSTHPLTDERISHFQEAGRHNHFSEKSSLDSALQMVKAKLSGFLEDSSQIWRRYPKTNTAPEKYAHSILYYRQGKINEALKLIDDLIKQTPNNPYFYEQKAQFLFESGNVAASIPLYRKALSLSAPHPSIQISLAHALIETDNGGRNLSEAVDLLNKAVIKQSSPQAWQLLSRAYDMQKKSAYAYYAAAEYSFVIGNISTAEMQLKKAAKIAKDKALSLKISDLQKRIKDENDE